MSENSKQSRGRYRNQWEMDEKMPPRLKKMFQRCEQTFPVQLGDVGTGSAKVLLLSGFPVAVRSAAPTPFTSTMVYWVTMDTRNRATQGWIETCEPVSQNGLLLFSWLLQSLVMDKKLTNTIRS